MFITRPVVALDGAPVVSAPVAPPVSGTTNAVEGGSADAAKTVAEKFPERVKFKSNGVDRDIPWAEAQRLLSLADGAHRKLEEANSIKKQTEDFEAKFKKNPLKALMDKGMTKDQAREVLENELIGELQYDKLTPEQKRLREYEEQDRARKEQDDAKKSEQQKDSERRELDQEIKNLDREFEQAYTQSGLPADPFLASWAVSIMKGAAHQGVDINPAQALSEVKAKLPDMLNAITSKMNPEQLKNYIGKDTLKKLRDADVAALKTANEPFAKPSAAGQVPKTSAPRQQGSEQAPLPNKDQWLARLRGQIK